MFKIAVTGSNGFLGKAFVRHARLAGFNLRLLIRSAEKVPEEFKNPNLGPVPEIIFGDLKDDPHNHLLWAGVDVLVHIAALGVQANDRKWDQVASINIERSLIWLKAAQESGVKHAVVAGTALEYKGYGQLPNKPSNSDAHLCKEKDSLETAEPYGASKAAGGILIRAWARNSKFPLWYMRFASCYGEGDNPKKLIPAIVSHVISRKKLELSPGDQVREWLHIDDAARAILAGAVQDPYKVQLVNVGTGIGTSIKEIVSLIDPKNNYVQCGKKPYRKGETHILVMDPTHCREVLQWSPKINFREGLDNIDASNFTT